MDGKKAKALDVFPFWERVRQYLDFVGGRLKFGQTDAGATSIDDYLELSYKALRDTIVTSDADARVAARLLFWDDCKKAFAPVFDCQAKKTIGSPSFADFYGTLYKLQRLALASPKENWRSGERPASEPFPSQAPQRERSRSARRAKGNGKGGGKAAQQWRAAQAAKEYTPDVHMGNQGVWSWDDPPTVLVEQEGFLILSKPPFWVCDTPPDPKEFDTFVPNQRCKGHLTIWLRERYGKKHEFMMKYSEWGSKYGLVNRLDRETSGAVVVGKNQKLYGIMKKMRDDHDWFKEYVCLVHGKIPVDKWQGVIETGIKQAKNNNQKYSEVADYQPDLGPTRLPPLFEPAISHYQVLDYYRSPSDTSRFTLVKVRIITGKQHQIRVHMQYILQKLGDAVLDGKGPGLVSDFLYLERAVSQEDQKTLCDRVFLHEQTLGFWDPTATARWVCARSELPEDLQSCLDKLKKDTLSNEEFKHHLQAKAESDPVDAFCQKYKLGPQENQDLRKGCWQDEEKRRWFFEKFEEQAGSGLESMSVKGDHTFLFEVIRKNAEVSPWTSPWDTGRNKRGVSSWDIIKQAVDTGIYWRLWEQGMAKDDKEAREAQANQPVAEGWRKMELNGSFFYLHASGRRQQRRPVPDPDLLLGWLKLESESRPGEFFYFNEKTRKTLSRPPRVEDDIPAGWVRQKSRNEPDTFYYIHIQTGTVQLGMPCEGPLEDLPEGWEKVRSSKGGDPFYFHRALSVSVYQRPTANTAQALEYGWQVHRSKSTGKEYFYNPYNGKNQMERPLHPAKPLTN